MRQAQRAPLLLLLLLAAAPYIPTTAAGTLSVRGAQLLLDGAPILLRGVNYFGFNNAQTAPDGLWQGSTSLTKDVSTVMYRQQLLGFNAVRLPFSFKDLAIKAGRTDYMACTPASEGDIRASVTPPGLTVTKPLPKPRAPLTVAPGRCNVGMPANVFDRFLWVVRMYAQAGFVVVVDNHVWLEDPTAYEDTPAWVAGWARLVAAIAKDPVTSGMVIFDLVNEPDNTRLFWESRSADRPSLTSLYQAAMQAVYKVHPSAIFMLEGTGQIAHAATSGDGFTTDQAVIASYKGKRFKTPRYVLDGIEDPTPFFKWLLQQPFAKNVVFSPHVYPQSIVPFELPAHLMEPPGLFRRMSDSFGYLTKGGFCGGAGACQTWPVVVGEFCAPNAPGDAKTMDGLVAYLNNAGPGRDGRHEAIGWIVWAWNANTPDTGGLVKDDWATIEWRRIDFLRRIGLTPWYA